MFPCSSPWFRCSRPWFTHASAFGARGKHCAKNTPETPLEREETSYEPFYTKKLDPKKLFNLVCFQFFHARDRGLDRGARQDGFVVEKDIL